MEKIIDIVDRLLNEGHISEEEAVLIMESVEPSFTLVNHTGVNWFSTTTGPTDTLYYSTFSDQINEEEEPNE